MNYWSLLDRIPAAYRPEVWKRLVEVKTKWDPNNLFRMNQNIQPTDMAASIDAE